MAETASDYGKLAELQHQLTATTEEQAELEEAWLDLRRDHRLSADPPAFCAAIHDCGCWRSRSRAGEREVSWRS